MSPETVDGLLDRNNKETDVVPESIKELIPARLRRIVNASSMTRPKEHHIVKNYALNDDDAAQVRAILLTHAEMQDRQSIANEELRGRPGQDGEMVVMLAEANADIDGDVQNLKRIAKVFE